MSQKNIQLSISGMHCASCVAGIESALQNVPGVQQASVNFAARTAEVQGQVAVSALINAVKAAGYEAALLDDVDTGIEEFQLYQRRLLQACVAFVIGVPLLVDDFVHFIPTSNQPYIQWFWPVIGIVVYGVMIFSGKQIYKGFWQSLKSFQGNMDTLVGMGTGVAWLYSMVVSLFPMFIPAMARNTYFDTTALLLAFITFGNALEIKARGKTSQAIQRLMGLQPKTARVLKNGEAHDVPIASIQLGDQIRLRPGEQVAVDGVVLEGESHIDESMLTGESLPLHKQSNDKLYAGTVNKTGSVVYEATNVGKDTALSRIIQTVQQAQNSKPAVGRLVDKVSAIFVPIVLLCMVLTVIGWSVWGPKPTSAFVLTTAVAVLVIACPCALGLATPLSIMVGVGKAAEKGVLIRNGDSLQVATKIDTVVCDKTGTITEGRPAVVGLMPVSGVSESDLLQTAASIEVGSEHPLGEAIVAEAKTRQLILAPAAEFQAVSGLGITAVVQGQSVALGNNRFMQQHQIDVSALDDAAHAAASRGETPIYVSKDNALMGVISIADPVKHDSADAIAALKKMGLTIVMLTGDNAKTANAIAKTLQIDHVIAEVLPAQKAEKVKALQAAGKTVAMVGDGINDAPALTQAHLGIAMGAGADVAIESADLALMTGSLQGVMTAIKLSRATMRNIAENLFGAFIYNSIGIPLAAGVFYPLGHWLLNPLIAGAAMALSSVTVVLNANRLRFYRI